MVVVVLGEAESSQLVTFVSVAKGCIVVCRISAMMKAFVLHEFVGAEDSVDLVFSCLF